jgi:Predicted ABC-type transport system involved in lysophospholipase L1 biosynthesis, permease component
VTTFNTFDLIRRNLFYYRRTNLAVVLGAATAVAVLAGSLVVGDSVRGSLRELVIERLGATNLVLSGPAFFREDLAREIASASAARACPIIAMEGIVSGQGSPGRRASGVLIYGVDERFWRFHGKQTPPMTDGREAFLSPALAHELGLREGDSVLIRVEEPSEIPKESLHGRKDLPGKIVRFSVGPGVTPAALGEFSLQPQQSAVRAIFVPLRRLQRDLGVSAKANTVLVDPQGVPIASVEKAVREAFALEDISLRLRKLDDQRGVAIESNGGILPAALSDRITERFCKNAHSCTSLFTYLVNTIRIGEREIPYSLVTGVDENVFSPLLDSETPPIILNQWAARELKARPGDSVELEYYVWRSDGRLETQKAQFRLESIVPISGFAAHRDVAPHYPGITDADNLRNWDPPFPMDLKRIRQSDEDYWDLYRTTPKAYIPLRTAQRFWESRYGSLTSIRIAGVPEEQLQRDLRASLDPFESGLVLLDVRNAALTASQGATDFGEYFVYFSFFLVVSALLLAGLFFRLGVDQRLREIGLLAALGFPRSRIQLVFLCEGLLLAAIGGAAGALGGLGYGWFILYGLRTWWADAVGTSLLRLHASPLGVLAGAAGGVVAALAFIAVSLRALKHVEPRSLLAGVIPAAARRANPSRRMRFAIAAGFAGALLLLLSGMHWTNQAAGFFGGGTLLLIALLAAQSSWLLRGQPARIDSILALGIRNASWKPGRSLLSISLMSAAAFLLVSTDAFRRSGQSSSLDPGSGNGGFALLAESQLPLFHNPNTQEGRETLLLDSAPALSQAVYVPFRLKPGDDVSCLNLYQPRNPRILAASPSFRSMGRFAFQETLSQTPEEQRNPWRLLEGKEHDGAIPAIVDQNSMTYVLHKSLGDDVVIQREGSPDIRLRIVGTLKDSIFQGELIISEENFLRAFPHVEGFRFFLIEPKPGAEAETSAQLEEALSDFGFDVISTADKLAGFHKVENAYLSTFQSLGGLGLILGTVGLAAVLLRNVLERRRELALLRSFGYGRTEISRLILAENIFLLAAGLGTGGLCAVIAVLPAWLARGGHHSGFTLGLLLPGILAAGLAASVFAVRRAIQSPLLESLRGE